MNTLRISWQIFILAIASIFCTVISLLFSGDKYVTFLALVYSIYIAIILYFLPEKYKFSPLFSAVFISLVLTYLSRLIGLSIYNYSFALSGPFIPDLFFSILLLIGTTSFILGFSFPLPIRLIKSEYISNFTINMSNLKLFSIANVIILLLYGYIRVIQRVGFDYELSSSYGFATRVLPVDALAYANILLIVMSRISKNNVNFQSVLKYASIPFLLYFGINLVSGGRGIVFQLIFYLIFALSVTDQIPNYLSTRIIVKYGFISVAIAAIIPLIFSISVYFREATRLQLDTTLFEIFSLDNLLYTLTSRYAGPDTLMLVTQIQPPDFFNTLHITYSTLSAVVPDFLLNDFISSHIPIGKVFGIYYQGLPDSFAHHGAFYGIALFYALYGYLFPVIIMTVCFIIRILYYLTIPKRPNLVHSFFFTSLVFGIISSGNIDSILSSIIPQSVIAYGIMRFINPVRLSLSEPLITYNLN